MSPSLKHFLVGVLSCADFVGFDPRRLVSNVTRAPAFWRDVWTYSRLNQRPSFRVRFSDIYAVLNERTAPAGNIRGHYFHQDLWAARKIFARRPARHIDIGSSVDGFVAHLLVFMPVTLVDIRPLKGNVPSLEFIQDDATQLARFESDSVDSISSLHAAEHFGLGRYSDPINPDACFRFMQALERVLSPGGRLYFSVPVGRERVQFNAHRVFGIQTVLRAFPALRLSSFSFVGDDGLFYPEIEPAHAPESRYGCGLFEFTKP